MAGIKITAAGDDGMNFAWMVELQPGDGTRYTIFVWDYFPVTGKQELVYGGDGISFGKLDRQEALAFLDEHPEIMTGPGDYQRNCIGLQTAGLILRIGLSTHYDLWAALAVIRAIGEIVKAGLIFEDHEPVIERPILGTDFERSL